MNISNQNNNQAFSLSSGSNNNKSNLNYNQADYNNYQNWSNVGRGFITISSIDENSNTLKNQFKTSRIQPLSFPTSTFTDTILSWAPVDSVHSTINNNFLKNNNNK
jgi:hypothetical protein